MNSTSLHQEETLDPADWSRMNALGAEMVSDILEHLATLRQRPLWQPLPQELLAYLNQPLPLQGMGEEETYLDMKKNFLPFATPTLHPRFWGWVIGSGSAYAALAEMLAAFINPNVGGGEQPAAYVELQVLDWLKQMFGFPSTASGILVSGGSMANLVGLTVARNRRAGYDVRLEGVAAAPHPFTVYASAQVHSSVHKAVEMLGLGRKALREIPNDAEYRIDLHALRAAIRRDREDGFMPLCVIGCAGTVKTGAFDDLVTLAEICRQEDLWFHVDGAFGALAALSPELRPLTAGMEQADSLAFDLHKWMSMPYEVGCCLVRDAEEHRQAFAFTPDYLAHQTRGIAAGDVWLSDYGIQLSRGFRALKVWMSLKAHGVELYGRLIRQNVAQARELAALVDASPWLELMAPVPLNIVIFRYNPGNLAPQALDDLNQELLYRMHESGEAATSYATVDGRFGLRACFVNHRTRRSDLTSLVALVERLGKEITSSSH